MTDLFFGGNGVDWIHALTQGAVHAPCGVAVTSVAEHLHAGGTGHLLSDVVILVVVVVVILERVVEEPRTGQQVVPSRSSANSPTPQYQRVHRRSFRRVATSATRSWSCLPVQRTSDSPAGKIFNMQMRSWPLFANVSTSTRREGGGSQFQGSQGSLRIFKGLAGGFFGVFNEVGD